VAETDPEPMDAFNRQQTRPVVALQHARQFVTHSCVSTAVILFAAMQHGSRFFQCSSHFQWCFA
jgi:hypothetical protein